MKKYIIKLYPISLLLALLALWACGSDAAPATLTKPVNTVTATTPASVSTTAPVATSIATTVPRSTTTAAVNPVPTVTTGNNSSDFSGPLALEHVKDLADKIGVRAVGTTGHDKAADYLEMYYKNLGFQLNRPTVTITSYNDNGSYLRYKDGSGQPIEIKGNAVSLSGTGTVNGSLVYAGLGDQIPANSLRGKIALIMRGQITFQAKVDNAKQAGAIGVVIYNDQDSALSTATLVNPSDIPVLGLSKKEGQQLRDLMAAPNSQVQVNLEVQLNNTQIKFTNVVAIRPGNKTGAPLVIIGGHYDSVPAGPGANDNGSGTAIVMELARVLATKYPQYEFRFLAFGGEEVGLTGSVDYVKNMTAEERQRVVAMLNIDMVAVGNTLWVGGDPGLVKLALGASAEEGAGDVQVLAGGGKGMSDHDPFATAGMRVLFFNRQTDPNYHKAGDTSDKILPDRLEQIGKIVIKVIDRLPSN